MRYFIFIFNGRGGNGVIFGKSAGYKGHCNKGGRTIPRAFKAEGNTDLWYGNSVALCVRHAKPRRVGRQWMCPFFLG